MFNVWQNLQSAVFLYFTKLFAVIHSLTDCICFRTALAAMNCAYTVLQCIWQIFLFKAYCNFKEAYAAIQLSGTAIISGSHLQGPVFWRALSFFQISTCNRFCFQTYRVNSPPVAAINSTNGPFSISQILSNLLHFFITGGIVARRYHSYQLWYLLGFRHVWIER